MAVGFTAQGTSVAADTYQRTAVESADPQRLVLMLFAAAVRFLHQAAAAMAQRQYEQQNRFITSTQQILTELTCALDDSVDAEFCGNLRLLYTWLYTQLTEANLEDDTEKLAQVTELVEDLRAAWVEAETRCRKSAA